MASLRVNVTVPLLITIVENEKHVSKVPGCGGWLGVGCSVQALSQTEEIQ